MLAGNPLWKLFQLFQLDEIMRQRDDLTFAQCLTRLAKGELTNEDVALFESRCFSNENDLPVEAKNTIRLIWTNKDVDAYNYKRLEEIRQKFPSNINIIVHGIDKVARGDYTEFQVKQGLEKAKHLSTQHTHGLPTELKLQVGARYMVTTNIDVADGLFNGATGVLKNIDIQDGKAYTIFIKFDDKTVGRKARTTYRNLERQIDSSWTPLAKRKEQFTVTKQITVVREQYPLVPAEAITINKSQGQSLEAATIQLDPRMDRSLLYVACSRVTNIKGLFLIGKFKPPNPPNETHAPTIEMKRMQQEALLIPKFQHLHQVPDGVLQIVSHNVQSLRAHLKTIERDEVFTNSKLLLFQETWLHEKENITIKGRVETVRSCITGVTRGRGTIIFNDPLESFEKLGTLELNEGNHYFEASSCRHNDVMFVNVYISPGSSKEFFEACCYQSFANNSMMNVVLVIDMNDDILKSESRVLYLKEMFGLQLVSPKKATTDIGTCLDAVFSNCADYDVLVQIYESYFSYHKPLVIRLVKK